MKYFTIYTFALVATLIISLSDRGPALSDALMAIGAHACGCMAASIFWLIDRVDQWMLEAEEMKAKANTP